MECKHYHLKWFHYYEKHCLLENYQNYHVGNFETRGVCSDLIKWSGFLINHVCTCTCKCTCTYTTRCSQEFHLKLLAAGAVYHTLLAVAQDVVCWCDLCTYMYMYRLGCGLSLDCCYFYMVYLKIYIFF